MGATRRSCRVSPIPRFGAARTSAFPQPPGRLSHVVVLQEPHKRDVGSIRREMRKHDGVWGGCGGVLGRCVAAEADLCACSRGSSWLCGEFEAKVLHLCEY